MISYSISRDDVMNLRERRLYKNLSLFGYTLVALFLLWWIQPQHISHNYYGKAHIIDLILFLLLSYVVWYQIINECFSWFIAGFMKKPRYARPERGSNVAFLTAFVPDKEPYDVLEKTLSAMVKVDYPHDTWLLDEGDDITAKKMCKKYGVKHFSRKGIDKYNTSEGPYKMKTKGGNYNAWFDQHAKKYDYVAQLDMDFVPKKNYLTQTLGYFRDPDIAFVGTPQIYGNTKKSWIAQGAAEQAYNFYGSMQKGLYGHDMTLFIGANHIVRVIAHNDVDGYSGHIVEDHLTGMNFYARRWKSVYVGENLAVGEGPATWSAYFSQQMRWAYGLIDILFRHSPNIFPTMRKHHIMNYFLLQQYYFYGVAQFIGVILLSLYFFLGIEITTMRLIPLLSLYIPLIFYQQVFFIWLQRFNINPSVEKGLMIRGKILNWAAWPIYFLACIGVLCKKRLTYAVTPKGHYQNSNTCLSYFYPHLTLGLITLFCLFASMYNERSAPMLIFWAILNTFMMLGFFINELGKKIMIMTIYVFNLVRAGNTRSAIA